MGSQFLGCFSDGDDEVLEAALVRWPFCTGKMIRRPFRGFGVRCPDPERIAIDDQDHDHLVERYFSVEAALPDWSRDFPGLTFVFIRADCFGRRCVYTGYVVRGGETQLRVDRAEVGTASLRRLLRPLGVRLLTGHFAPFRRGYWDHPG